MRLEKQARRWLDGFAVACHRNDAEAAASLFRPDGHWRDVLAFTWHLRTVSGPAQIKETFARTLPQTGANAFALHDATPPRLVQRAGSHVVEVTFDFRTAVGSGRGVARLLPGDGNELQASTLTTTLVGLDAFPERRGENRPRGEAGGRTFGGSNWLDKRRDEAAYDDREPAVLIVGGAQCGLGIAARLRILGIDALVVERLDRVGDVWRNRYHSLVLHNETWVNDLPYLPFPDTMPVFMAKDQLADWLEHYANAMELNVWTGTECVSAERDDDGRWTVQLRRGDGGRTVRPRHVVMATGVSNVPYIPDIPGLDAFGGRVLHTTSYREASEFAGQRVLVIGTGTSGHDVAQDLYPHAADVTIVQRSATTVVNVEPTALRAYELYAGGVATEEADLLSMSTPYPVMVRGLQLMTAAMRAEDQPLLDGLEAVGFRLDFGHDDTGFQMKYLRRGGGYYLNVGCSDLIAGGKIGLLQSSEITGFEASGVRLNDGRTLPVDAIILATGYEPQQELVRRIFGDDIAGRVGPIWGYDDDGELRNVWKRTAQPGLWFHAGSLAHSRIYSRVLALQIAASELGLIRPLEGTQ